jgi:hypothetical protein
MVTSGPFNISAYEAGGLLEFTFNPNYFFDIRPDGYETTSPTNPSNPQLGSDALAALQVGIVVAVIVVIVGIYSLHKRQYSH